MQVLNLAETRELRGTDGQSGTVVAVDQYYNKLWKEWTGRLGKNAQRAMRSRYYMVAAICRRELVLLREIRGFQEKLTTKFLGLGVAVFVSIGQVLAQAAFSYLFEDSEGG